MATLRLDVIPKLATFEREFKKAMSKVVKEIGKIEIGGGEGRTPIPLGKGMLKMTAVLATISVANFMIERHLKAIREDMAKASPAYAGMREIMDKTYNLALKPVADIQAILLKPFLQLMMQRLRKGMREVAPILQRIRERGGTPTQEEIAQINKIFEGVLTDFVYLRQTSNVMLGSIDATIGGFKATMETLSGTGNTISTVFQGILRGLEGALGAVTAKPSEDLMKDMYDKFKGNMALLPPIIREQIEKAVGAEDTSTALKTEMKSAFAYTFESLKTSATNIDVTKDIEGFVRYILEKSKAQTPSTTMVGPKFRIKIPILDWEVVL